ncbi:mycothiol transferase [Kibdelosporangium phytohabitans]|uniref:Chorismate synthase n=1 Tax=Kibdelosporangium phytohabitans TaxID=860235 RepID=A0A0N9I9M5_9PSEU|nr:DUF664 domain-containing protein [Kibdelosporangium phytohabitans]ALG11392.1 hypothetical protein AOZ06_35025 [Kibdelosporangium phytohabitans]MBE1462719.1 putative damage-inducible protein DinB [Kibdelosporangium phytohabitans]
MPSTDLLTDAFDRVKEEVHATLDGLTPDNLAYRVTENANSIAWLIWHLTRVQDDHIADLAGTEQVWTAQGWAKRFGLPLGEGETGYGHTADQVAKVQSTAELLAGYYDATHEQTIAYVKTLTDDDHERIVDTAWDPPVTLAVRLISVIGDDLEHVGQAAFIRGLLTN